MPSSDKRMVVGHTRQNSTNNKHLNLIGSDGNEVEVFCVDGGIAYDGFMFKYDGGSSVKQTYFYGHDNTAPNSKDHICIVTIDKNREALYQDFILGKVLCDGQNGYNTLINGDYPKTLGVDGRNRVIRLFYDGLYDYDELTKRYLYVNTFLFDYVIECQIERMLKRTNGNADDAKVQASWLMDMYLNGFSTIDKSSNEALKGDINCFTSHRDARKIAGYLGEKGIREVLAVHGVNNIEDYINSRFVKSQNGKRYIKK